MRKLISWSRSPIVIPRWVLTLKYFLFVCVGVTVYVASSPSLDITTWAGYTPFWSIALMTSGLLSMIGSTSPQLEVLERWSVLVLTALLVGYAFAPVSLVLAGDADRASYSVIAICLSLLPGSRAAMLIHRTGKPHV